MTDATNIVLVYVFQIYTYITASNGERVRVGVMDSGMETGYAYIGSGYFAGLEHWKIKDGDTVIGCEPDHPGAMPVADAYQEWHRRAAIENKYLDEELARMEREYHEGTPEQQAEIDPTVDLYEIQERLETGR